MIILGVEGSGLGCSVCLYQDGQIQQKINTQSRQHGEFILQAVDELLKENKINLKEINLIAIGIGPGSFTGLRILTGVVQGLAYPNNTPIATLSSLQNLAQTAFRLKKIKQIVCVINAHMGEVYVGKYQLNNNLMLPTEPDSRQKTSELNLLDKEIILSDHPDIISSMDFINPESQDLIPLALAQPESQWISAIELVPEYLGQPDYQKKK